MGMGRVDGSVGIWVHITDIQKNMHVFILCSNYFFGGGTTSTKNQSNNISSLHATLNCKGGCVWLQFLTRRWTWHRPLYPSWHTPCTWCLDWGGVIALLCLSAMCLYFLCTISASHCDEKVFLGLVLVGKERNEWKKDGRWEDNNILWFLRLLLFIIILTIH